MSLASFYEETKPTCFLVFVIFNNNASDSVPNGILCKDIELRWTQTDGEKEDNYIISPQHWH